MKESLSVNILLIIVKIDCLAFIRESSMTKKWCMGLITNYFLYTVFVLEAIRYTFNQLLKWQLVNCLEFKCT